MKSFLFIGSVLIFACQSHQHPSTFFTGHALYDSSLLLLTACYSASVWHTALPSSAKQKPCWGRKNTDLSAAGDLEWWTWLWVHWSEYRIFLEKNFFFSVDFWGFPADPSGSRCLGPIAFIPGEYSLLQRSPNSLNRFQVQNSSSPTQRQMMGFRKRYFYGLLNYDAIFWISLHQNFRRLYLHTPNFGTPCCLPCRLPAAKIKMLVLDEADEMLNRGFKEQARCGNCKQRHSSPHVVGAQSLGPCCRSMIFIDTFLPPRRPWSWLFSKTWNSRDAKPFFKPTDGWRPFWITKKQTHFSVVEDQKRQVVPLWWTWPVILKKTFFEQVGFIRQASLRHAFRKESMN